MPESGPLSRLSPLPQSPQHDCLADLDPPTRSVSADSVDIVILSHATTRAPRILTWRSSGDGTQTSPQAQLLKPAPLQGLFRFTARCRSATSGKKARNLITVLFCGLVFSITREVGPNRPGTLARPSASPYNRRPWPSVLGPRVLASKFQRDLKASANVRSSHLEPHVDAMIDKTRVLCPGKAYCCDDIGSSGHKGWNKTEQKRPAPTHSFSPPKRVFRVSKTQGCTRGACERCLSLK